MQVYTKRSFSTSHKLHEYGYKHTYAHGEKIQVVHEYLLWPDSNKIRKTSNVVIVNLTHIFIQITPSWICIVLIWIMILIHVCQCTKNEKWLSLHTVVQNISTQ